MDPLTTVMQYYPYVFHPVTVLGVGTLVLIHYEWARQAADRSVLGRRVLGFLGAGVLSLAPTGAYMLLTGAGPAETMSGNAWQVDALVAGGVVIAAGGTWYLWTRLDWGPLVPTAMQAIVAATVPYGLLSPVWNVSGHVVIALAPTLYLALVDRTFGGLLAVPVVMVPNRVYLDAHTWAQAVGGFAIATVAVTGVYWIENGRSLRPATESTAPVGDSGGVPPSEE